MEQLVAHRLALLHVFLEALRSRDSFAWIIRLDWCRVLGMGLSSERPSLLKSLSTILGSRVGVNSLSKNNSGRAERRSRGEGRSRSNKSSKDNSTL